MVVVLVVIARAATPAKAADAVFRANGWAANMGQNCTGWRSGRSSQGDAVIGKTWSHRKMPTHPVSCIGNISMLPITVTPLASQSRISVRRDLLPRHHAATRSIAMKSQAALYITLAALLLAKQACAQTTNPPGQTVGEQVYKTVCIACHDSGVAHAPKFGDATAWAPLIAEGQPVLTGHAWVGVRAMPARGGSAEISLQDFAKAVAYMASNAGGDWKDPDPAMMKKIIREADKRLIKTIKEQQAMQRELHRLAK
jgi:cytochrome c5